MIFNGSSIDLRSVVADPFGNLYLTDANSSQVRRITPNGVISLFAGYVSGTACLPTASTPCTATLVKLNKPRGIFADAFGNIFIAGYSDNKVYEVKAADGLMYLIAGNGTRPSDPTQTNGDGGAATAALINQPRGVAADTYGNIYIADTADNKVREVDTSGNIQTIVGTGASSSTGDGGASTAATVSNPQGVLTDPSDNLYIADAARVRVVCITCISGSGLYNLLQKLGVTTPTNGYIYTIAGTGSGTYNYTAPALANTVNVSPQKLAMDASTNLYISDSSGVVWFLDAHTGTIRLLAGKGTTCNTSAIGDGCLGTQATFGTGSGGGIGVGIDLQGNVYVADTLNARIRKISNNLSFSTTAKGASLTQPVELHLIAGDTLGTTTLPLASTDFTLSTVNCSTNADTSQDCNLTATFAPTAAGRAECGVEGDNRGLEQRGVRPDGSWQRLGRDARSGNDDEHRQRTDAIADHRGRPGQCVCRRYDEQEAAAIRCRSDRHIRDGHCAGGDQYSQGDDDGRARECVYRGCQRDRDTGVAERRHGVVGHVYLAGRACDRQSQQPVYLGQRYRDDL